MPDRELAICPVCGGLIDEGVCQSCHWDGKDSFYDNGRFDNGCLIVDSCERPACIGKIGEETHFCPCLLSFSIRFNAVSVWCDPLKEMVTIQ